MSKTARLYGFVVLWLLVGCSGGGSCGGCGALEPLPTGRFVGERVESAMTARLTADGYAVLNDNWQLILARFAPGQTMEVPLECSIKNFPVLGDVAVADEGAVGCTSETCGQLDGKCDALDQPKLIPIAFSGMHLAPRSPDEIEVEIQATVSTGKIMVDTVNRNHFMCLFSNPMKCGIDFDSARAPPLTNTFSAALKLTIDTRWDRLLSFTVDRIDGAQTCGSSGAPPAPRCMDPADLVIQAEGSCQTCDVADWGVVKTFLLGQLAGSLKNGIQDAIDAQTCEPCGPGGACPQLASAQSACDTASGHCLDTTTQRCVPKALGVEGRLPVGTILASSGAPEDSRLDLSIAAGGSASSTDAGTNVAILGAAREAAVPSCVRPLPPPALVQQPPPAFDAHAPGPYDVAFSISRQFLDHAFHGTHQSGAMCLAITSSTVSQLNSGVFELFLGSLGKLTGPEDVPMMVALRPSEPPRAAVGAGTVVDGKLEEPLVTMSWKDLAVDFYALLEDRQVRLFTLTVDVELPLGLLVEGCDGITPVLGNLRDTVTNVRASNSEILAEDPSELAALIPGFMGMAEPFLAGGLSSMSLPAFGDFKLKLESARGIGQISGTQAFEHIGFYAKLLRADAACAVAAPRASARLKRAAIPSAERMRGAPLPWPSAILEVASRGLPGTPEFSHRVDRGPWSPFAPAPAGELEVSHPLFLLQGRHLIEVRARVSEHPTALSAPVAVDFTVDWSAPEVSLRVDRPSDRVVVEARDLVTPPEALRYAYRVGDGPFGDYGPAREVSLSAVEAAGGFAVRVRDEAGLWGEARYRVPTTHLRDDAEPPEWSPAAGCSSAPGLGAAALLGLLAILRRRSRSLGG